MEKVGELVWIFGGSKKVFYPKGFRFAKTLFAPEKFFDTVILKVAREGNYGKMTVWHLFENLRTQNFHVVFHT